MAHTNAGNTLKTRIAVNGRCEALCRSELLFSYTDVVAVDICVWRRIAYTATMRQYIHKKGESNGVSSHASQATHSCLPNTHTTTSQTEQRNVRGAASTASTLAVCYDAIYQRRSIRLSNPSECSHTINFYNF